MHGFERWSLIVQNSQTELKARKDLFLLDSLNTCSSNSDLIYKKKNQACDGSNFIPLESIASSLPRLELKFGN